MKVTWPLLESDAVSVYVPDESEEKSEKGTVALVIGHCIGDVDAEPVPVTPWEATLTPPGELNETVPEQLPPVIVSPLKVTATEVMKLKEVAPPVQPLHVRESGNTVLLMSLCVPSE